MPIHDMAGPMNKPPLVYAVSAPTKIRLDHLLEKYGGRIQIQYDIIRKKWWQFWIWDKELYVCTATIVGITKMGWDWRTLSYPSKGVEIVSQYMTATKSNTDWCWAIKGLISQLEGATCKLDCLHVQMPEMISDSLSWVEEHMGRK